MDKDKFERLYGDRIAFMGPPHSGKSEFLAHQIANMMEKDQIILIDNTYELGIEDIAKAMKSKGNQVNMTFMIEPMPKFEPVLAAIVNELKQSKSHKFNPSPPSDFYYNQHKRGKKDRHNRGKFI